MIFCCTCAAIKFVLHQELRGTILQPFLDSLLAQRVETYTASFLCTSMTNELTKRGLHLDILMEGIITTTKAREQW